MTNPFSVKPPVINDFFRSELNSLQEDEKCAALVSFREGQVTTNTPNETALQILAEANFETVTSVHPVYVVHGTKEQLFELAKNELVSRIEKPRVYKYQRKF